MRRFTNESPARRPGKVLLMFVFLLTALLGMVGLVVDTGLMMASQRQTQNAADSAALAAATELMRGSSVATATTAATTFVKTHNGLANATVNVTTPPSSGPHAGSYRHVEVTVTRPYTTYFIQVTGASSSQEVGARSVAGFEALRAGEGAIVMDPSVRPGLSVSGGATLRVNGAVVVNSQGKGLDQYGQTVDWGDPTYALTSGTNSTVKARYIQVRGGVDVLANYQNYEDGGPNPLYCRSDIGPDPLRELPVPRQSNVSSITNWTTRNPSETVSSGQTRTFSPGIYENIQINSGATVIFNPGVYIFSPTKPSQGLSVNGGCTITGNGVMFYLTGSNYLDGGAGYRDNLDDAQNALDGRLPPTNANAIPASLDPQSSQVKFATMSMNATDANVTLTGLSDESSPFKGMLFFQRRRNMTSPSIAGNAGVNVTLSGTIYAKWANFKLSGGGVYNAQFVVGSMAITGQAVVTINSTGKSFGRANQVFLVE